MKIDVIKLVIIIILRVAKIKLKVMKYVMMIIKIDVITKEKN